MDLDRVDLHIYTIHQCIRTKINYWTKEKNLPIYDYKCSRPLEFRHDDDGGTGIGEWGDDRSWRPGEESVSGGYN